MNAYRVETDTNTMITYLHSEILSGLGENLEAAAAEDNLVGDAFALALQTPSASGTRQLDVLGRLLVRLALFQALRPAIHHRQVSTITEGLGLALKGVYQLIVREEGSSQRNRFLKASSLWNFFCSISVQE